MIDLTKYKIVHSDKVYKAIALVDIDFKDYIEHPKLTYDKPIMIEILVINEDNNLMSIRDEAWCFQFISAISKSE